MLRCCFSCRFLVLSLFFPPHFSPNLDIVNVAHYAPNIFWNVVFRFEFKKEIILQHINPNVTSQRPQRLRRNSLVSHLTYTHKDGRRASVPSHQPVGKLRCSDVSKGPPPAIREGVSKESLPVTVSCADSTPAVVSVPSAPSS